MDDTGFTLEGRVLCSDDACVGTVGPDRRCKVCGRPYEGDAEIPSEESARAAAAEVGTSAKDPATDPPAPAASDADDSERVCCPDDACVGVIGPDGRCGVCGKTA